MGEAADLGAHRCSTQALDCRPVFETLIRVVVCLSWVACASTRVLEKRKGGAGGCLGRYGNRPEAPAQSLNGLPYLWTAAVDTCHLHGGRQMKWRDGRGSRRRACAFIPTQAHRKHPLPVVVFLQGSVFPAELQARLSGMEERLETADLTGDPARPGFILLVPEGRDTEHLYPFPDDSGLGWDNWYRDFDRQDPALNADAAAIDHFISELERQGIVDASRIYLSGWSNGSAMAILYALNSPAIAAVAVYSSPDPFGDFDDPCPQPPFGVNPLPIMHVHNACDTVGLCDSGERLKGALEQTFPGLSIRDVILDGDQQLAGACRADCARGTFLSYPLGSRYHLRWPSRWTDRMLEFLRDHPRGSGSNALRASSTR